MLCILNYPSDFNYSYDLFHLQTEHFMQLPLYILFVLLYIFLSKCFWKNMEAFRWIESSLDSQYVEKLHHVFIMSLQKKEKCCDDACSVLFCFLPSFLCLLYISPLVALRFPCSHLSQVEQHLIFFFHDCFPGLLDCHFI